MQSASVKCNPNDDTTCLCSKCLHTSRYLWWTWYPAVLMFHPGSLGSGIFAVLAIRCWTSLHVSSGLGQETWNRISSNASFLRPVFYTVWNHRGSTSTLILWKETCRELDMDSSAERGWRTVLWGLQHILSGTHVMLILYLLTHKPLRWDTAILFLQQVL